MFKEIRTFTNVWIPIASHEMSFNLKCMTELREPGYLMTSEQFNENGTLEQKLSHSV